MPVQFLDVAKRIELKAFRCDVVIIGQLRLNQNARFIGGLEELRNLAVRMVSDVVEAGFAGLGQMLEMLLPVRR